MFLNFCLVPLHTDELINRLTEIFEIPHVDFDGKLRGRIQIIAIVPATGYFLARLKQYNLDIIRL
jgi:hypothetical protein